MILQHFERGPKLNDSSNRYRHTCKACGEVFPKGRIDSLTTHLVKKCPAITTRGRQKALLEINGLSDTADGPRARNGDVQMNGPTVELPIAGRNMIAMTPLETLAEVSRQMEMTKEHDDPSANVQGAGNHTQNIRLAPKFEGAPDQPRADRLELQEQYTLDNPPVSYEQRVLRGKQSKFSDIPLQGDLLNIQ